MVADQLKIKPQFIEILKKELKLRKTQIDKNDFSIQLDHEKVKFDAVFIGMHGTPGEDGKLQGYFDTLKIPYTSCDAASSAIT
jgi:D-alanine-D-alanine ligase